MTKVCNPHPFQTNLARQSLAAWCCVAALAWPLAASAQSPMGNAKSKGPGDRILTRDELRACYKQRDDLKGQRDELDRDRSKLDAERTSLANDGTTLKAEFDALDRTSQEAVDNYNAKAKVRDAGVDTWNARNATAKDKEKAFDDTQAGWRKNCSERRFREEDDAALRKGK